jgi:hypothetical protein
MSNEAGVWIDHKKAVIANIDGKKETLREVTSGMEQHVLVPSEKKLSLPWVDLGSSPARPSSLS